jgi:O-antigen/teichoic acid export membrane protein
MNVFAKIRELRQWLRRDPIGATLFSLSSDSAVYLAGAMLIGLCNVVLVPLYTRTLGPREFGVYALLDITVLLVVAVAALKMDVSYLKWLADTEPSLRATLFGSMLLTGLATSAVGGGALFAFVASQAGVRWLQQSAHSFAWMLLPVVVLESLQVLLLTDLRARRMPVRYSTAAIIRLLVMLAASIDFLSVRHMGLYGLFLGRLAGDAAAFLYLTGLCAQSLVLKITPSLIRPMIRFGAPLIWSVFAVMLQDASGRYFLSRYGSMEQVGLLGAAVKIGAVFQMLIAAPFGTAWGGVLFQIAKESEARLIFSAIFNYVCLVTLGVALILSLFGATLFHLFTPPSFYPAIHVLPVILLVRSMSVIEQPASTGIFLSGRTSLLAISYTVGLGANLVLLRFLVPAYGLFGTVLAWLCGSTLVPLLFLWFGQSRYRLNFHFAVLAPPVVLWIAFMIATANWRIEASGHPTLYASMLSVLVCLVLGFTVVHDFRNLRKQIRLSAATIPALEVSSQ